MNNKYITAVINENDTYDIHNVLNGRCIKRGLSARSFNALREIIPSFKDSLLIAFNDKRMWQCNLLNGHRIKARGEICGVEPMGCELIWIKRMEALNTQFEVVCGDAKLIDKLTLSQAEWVITHIANSLIDTISNEVRYNKKAAK